MDIEDALSLADEAQRQLEADAAEMNAEMNANLGDAQVAFPMPDASSQFPLRLALAVPLHRWAHSVDGGPVVADRPGVE